MKTAARQLVVHVDAFEYGCCETPPAVGETLTGNLIAQPTSACPSPVRVTGWDRERDLMTFDESVARWNPSNGNPFDQPVGILLSWHSHEPGVHATGTVTAVHQIFLGPAHDPTRDRTLQQVKRIEKFPDPLLTAAGALEPGGAVVTLTDVVLVEPTDQEIADYQAAQEVASRTIHITAPPTYFGPTVPNRGERITVDLDDPTAEIRNPPPARNGGLATGVTRQVSEAVTSGLAGVTVFRRAKAGTPTSDITNDMFVVLVLDEP